MRQVVSFSALTALIFILVGCSENASTTFVPTTQSESSPQAETPPANPLAYTRPTPFPPPQTNPTPGIPVVAQVVPIAAVTPPLPKEDPATVPPPEELPSPKDPLTATLPEPVKPSEPPKEVTELPKTKAENKNLVGSKKAEEEKPLHDQIMQDKSVVHVNLASLEVQEHPDKNAQVETWVRSSMKENKLVCRLVDTTNLAIQGAKWLPLPINIFNVKKGRGHLSPAFNESLDFLHHKRSQEETATSCPVDLVRGKVFRALWRVSPIYLKENNEKKWKCSAQLEICLDVKTMGDGTFACEHRERWHEISKLNIHINKLRHVSHFRSSEREKDDIETIELHLRKLNNGVPDRNEKPEVRKIESSTFIAPEK